MNNLPVDTPPFPLNTTFNYNSEEVEEYLSLEKSLWNFSSIENIEGHDIIREKQSQLGKPCFFFTHSLNEDGQPMLLHAQIITDFITIEEIVEKFCLYFDDT